MECNIGEIPTEAAKLMVYLEKHRLLEVCRRVMLDAGIKRPENMRKYLLENLRKISDQVTTTRAFVLAPPIFDFDDFSKKLQKNFNIPTIVYTKKRKGCDGEKILKKFKKFLNVHNLNKKNIIFMNFPANRVDCLQFRKEQIDPINVVEIIPSFQIPFKTREQLEEDCKPYIKRFEQVRDFYGNISKIIHYGVKGNAPEEGLRNTNVNYKQTIDEIGLDIVELMRNTEVDDDQKEVGKFLPRVVVIGRRGSGRRTQAKALAKQFNLVLIDTEQLVLDHIKLQTPMGGQFRQWLTNNEYSHLAISSIIHEKILEEKSLKNGWVLVGYPHDVDGFKRLENFIVPPNKIIFLHCREREAIRRLDNKWKKNLLKIQDMNKVCGETKMATMDRHKLQDIAAQEFNYFNNNKKALLEYLQTKKETIHVDGNHTRATVTTKICSRIEQEQNDVGLNKLKKCSHAEH